MEKYTSEQIEEIAGMILMFGNYIAHKYTPNGLPGMVKEQYNIMTPLEIRNRVSELKQNPDRLEKLIGDEERIDRRVSEAIRK